ncbi:MAG: hypothetical protein ACMV0H_00200, partial [Aquaspirillum sp.]
MFTHDISLPAGLQLTISPSTITPIMLPLLDPKNDYIFKRLFAQSPELLSDLINSIRYDQPPITITDILNPNI